MPSENSEPAIKHWKHRELEAKRHIENMGFVVHDANILFRMHCPNIDLVVYGVRGAAYVQVKSSNRPASKDGVILDGAPWTEDQLFNRASIYNRHPKHFLAGLILISDQRPDGDVDYYLAPPEEFERILRKVGRAFASKPKRDGTKRKMFRKEAPRSELKRWRSAWHLLDSIR